MKLTVKTMGAIVMVKVEGSSLAEEVEMRNKLQALGVPCTPIEFEGSAENCLDYITGKSESELDEVEDEDDEKFYVLTDDCGQSLRVDTDEITNYVYRQSEGEEDALGWIDVYDLVAEYIGDIPEVTDADMDFLKDSEQLYGLTDIVYDRIYAE